MIKHLRIAISLTQEQFVAKVGVASSTINRWKDGRGTSSPLALCRIEEMRSELRKE